MSSDMGLLVPLETGFENYPLEYVAHNVPLIVLSGLGSGSAGAEAKLPTSYRDGALRIHCDVPVVTGSRAEDLLRAFQRYERLEDQWNARPASEGSLAPGFRFKVVGRSYELLPRKAKPPSQELGYDPPGSPPSRSPPLWILHSPISPLTPGSPLFPDGVMSPQWIAKHQEYIPSVFIAAFTFSADPTRSSLEDNQLKTEINSIKATLYRSEYKTRLAVVLVSDEDVGSSSDFEDRLSNIRRATGLDAKTGLFFLAPTVSSTDMVDFVANVLIALQPSCVEFYRDLTKHARRKKSRGNIPAPTAPPTKGSSQILSALGWSVRYDFKLGVFAEFRQEMESACRHYTSALESLLGPAGIFETTPSWSPRWQESRILADMVAMRILRCLLWSNLTSTAVQSWSNYRHRLRELIDRRGKGTSSYGWEAWESRWLRMMGELVRRAHLGVFLDQVNERYNVYAPPEKVLPVGERIQPFEHLHHPGYWFRIAAKHGRRRRRIAHDLPEDDCIPPGQSPASAMASRYGTYETYLCPEPWQERPFPGRKTYNHSKDIFLALEKAQGHFFAQPRCQAELCLDMAKELIRNKQHADAMELLFPLWSNTLWRRDQWWVLVFEVTRSLHECAKHLGDAKVVAATAFEMYSNTLAALKNQTYDLMHCDKDMVERSNHSLITNDIVELSAEKVAIPFSTTFAFAVAEGNAGEPLEAQLVVRSLAQLGSAPIIFDNIEIMLSGLSAPLRLKHSNKRKQKDGVVENVVFEGHDDAARNAEADLELREAQILVLQFPLIFREPGKIAFEKMVSTIHTSAASIQISSPTTGHEERLQWYYSGLEGLICSSIARDDSHTVHIRPRPPKMEIKLPNIAQHFYTDEEIEVEIELLNGEVETCEVTLEIHLLTDGVSSLFQWRKEGEEASIAAGGEHTRYIGSIQPTQRAITAIAFTAASLPTSYTVEVKALYHLLSDMATGISKSFTADLNITRAFEANYEFQPRVHTTPWPSFFNYGNVLASDANRESGHGLAQRWELIAHIASFTYEGVILSKTELRLGTISPQATAVITETRSSDGEAEVAPQQQIERSFIVDVVKASLEDRRSLELDLVLAISWHRPRSTKVITSLLPVNSFVLENGPRVLASVSQLLTAEQGGEEATNKNDCPLLVAQLSFTLENPTNHFLTFELNMEGPKTDGEWALSGTKISSLNLLPLSRETVSYRIIALSSVDEDAAQGRWLEVRFRVMDVYFRKVLRCVPASHGVRELEGKGGSLLIWLGVE